MSQGKELRLTLERFIQKAEEQTYLEIPFEVNDSYERIEVRLFVSGGDARSVIDLGMRSPERIAGWSGGARDSIFVGLEKATPGYLAGPIAFGTWAVLLGAYRVPAAGCLVTLEVTLVPPSGRWLKGDLHMHSIHSDGSYTIAEAMESCRSLGLDFIALTDHNTASQNAASLMPDERLLVIPGVELTSYKGHANLLGKHDVPVDFRIASSEAAAAELERAREKGAFVSLNHPFCPNCPWELGFDVPYDAVEVWNGPWRELNEIAVRWWHQQLVQGRRLVALGGSDTHSPNRFIKHGRPTASVWTETDTVSGIMDGLRAGRVVLSFDPNETFATITSGECGIGDTVHACEDETLPLDIEVTGTAGDLLTLWSDRGIEAHWQMEAPAIKGAAWKHAVSELSPDELEVCSMLDLNPFEAAASLSCEPKRVAYVPDGSARIAFAGSGDRLFYRLEARRFAPGPDIFVMTCLTNPLYVDHHRPDSRGKHKRSHG